MKIVLMFNALSFVVRTSYISAIITHIAAYWEEEGGGVGVKMTGSVIYNTRKASYIKSWSIFKRIFVIFEFDAFIFYSS